MNFKSIVNKTFFLLVVLAVLVLYVLHFTAQNKYVYVDSQKVLMGYKAMQFAKKDFESKTETWKANLDSLRVEAESKIKEYESKRASLSAKEKQLMEELIQTKQQQFVNYQQVVSEKAKKEDEEITGKVLAKINDQIKRYGKEKGYTIIMAATQYGNIVYAAEGIDITEDVLERLNAEYK